MGLTTAESNADARFGCDGGRHAQVLLQLHIAGATPHDWLLVRSLLQNYTMRVQVRIKDGNITYLPELTPEGGGMAQGLSTPSPLYTLLPRMLQGRVTTVLPNVAVTVHPSMMQSYNETQTKERSRLQPVTAECIRHSAWKMERILSQAQWQQ